MFKYLVLLALVLAVTHSEVIVLGDSNYTTFIEQNSYVFVQFYAPWCGHCKKLAPQFEKLAQAAEGKQYVIAKVDSTENELVTKQVEVEGYPTLKFVVNGYYIDYDGPRNAKDIQQWIEKFLSSKITPLTQQQVKEKIGSEDFLLIQGASAEQTLVLEVANAVEKTVKYYSLPSEQPKITLYLKNSKTFDFTGEISVTGLTGWTRGNTLPIIVPFASKQHIKLVFQGEQKLPVFLLLKRDDLTAEAFASLTAICEQNKNSFKCGYGDSTHDVFDGIARYLKAEESDKSVLAYILHGMSAGYAFPNPNEISQQAVTQFLEDIKEDKIQKLIDKEAGQKEKQISFVNVLKLTEATYNQTLQTNKYVFIKYYSPNCGHCHSFAPEYEKLATQLKQEKSDFVIAAVDLVTEEGIAQWVSVQGYPTLRFYVNGNELNYEGKREGADIIDFMNSASKSKLLTAASVEEIAKPAVVIYGISADSSLNLLPVVFTKYPIYHIAGDKPFTVQLYDKQFHSISGEQSFSDVLDWLEDTTEPLIVNIVATTPSKRLSKSLQSQIPLLAIVERDQSSKGVLAIFEKFCLGRVQIVCGYATKGDEDYDSFNNWLGDPETEKSRLLYLKTDTYAKYFYPGDLTTFTVEDLETFVKEVNAGNIKPHANPEAEAAEEVETAQTVEQTDEQAAEATETTEEPAKASETTEEPAQATETTEEPAQASETTEEPAQASETTEQSAKASETAEQL